MKLFQNVLGVRDGLDEGVREGLEEGVRDGLADGVFEGDLPQAQRFLQLPKLANHTT